GEIEQDGAGLEDRDRLAAAGRIVVDDGGDGVVGGTPKKFLLELLALADIDRDQLVFQPGFFEENRDFVAVRRGPVMYVDHGKPLRDDADEAPSLADIFRFEHDLIRKPVSTFRGHGRLANI